MSSQDRKWNIPGWEPGNGCGRGILTHTERCINRHVPSHDSIESGEAFRITCFCPLHLYACKLMEPQYRRNMDRCPCTFHEAPEDDQVETTKKERNQERKTLHEEDLPIPTEARCWELPLTTPPTELPVTLTPEEADRSCRQMGCKSLIIELKSRCRVQYFHPENPFIMHSIYLCMLLDLDFGLVYAHFRAFKHMKDAGICGNSSNMSCESSELFTAKSCPNTTWWQTLIKGRKSGWAFEEDSPEYIEITCLLAKLPPADPKTGANLQLRRPPRDTHAKTTPSDRVEYFMHNPYGRMPRRIWDLAANRVIMSNLIRRCWGRGCERCKGNTTVKPGYVIAELWAITHSWVAPGERENIWSNINGKQWEIPIPQHVTLEEVMREVRLLISRQYNSSQQPTFYCWLDILCLRQDDHYEQDSKVSEWTSDIPTIGNIFRLAAGTIRYFNGLGKPFSTAGWDSERHWLNRAWTLQEVKPEPVTLNGGVDPQFYRNSSSSSLSQDQSSVNTLIPLNTVGRRAGGAHREISVTLRDALIPLMKIASDAENGKCKIIDLLEEMHNRHATTDRDKVAGLTYLLRPTRLPRYYIRDSVEHYWVMAVATFPRHTTLELVFNYPLCRAQSWQSYDYMTTSLIEMQCDNREMERERYQERWMSCNWIPNWYQIVECPKIDSLSPVQSGFDHKLAEISDLYKVGVVFHHSCFVLRHCLILDAPSSPPDCGVFEYIVLPNPESQVIALDLPIPDYQKHMGENYDGFDTLETDGGIGFFSPFKPGGLTQGKSSVNQRIPAGYYTLVTHRLDDLSGWAVCQERVMFDQIGTYSMKCLPEEGTRYLYVTTLPKGLCLKKMGVLRTDFPNLVQRSNGFAGDVPGYFF